MSPASEVVEGREIFMARAEFSDQFDSFTAEITEAHVIDGDGNQVNTLFEPDSSPFEVGADYSATSNNYVDIKVTGTGSLFGEITNNIEMCGVHVTHRYDPLDGPLEIQRMFNGYYYTYDINAGLEVTCTGYVFKCATFGSCNSDAANELGSWSFPDWEDDPISGDSNARILFNERYLGSALRIVLDENCYEAEGVHEQMPLYPDRKPSYNERRIYDVRIYECTSPNNNRRLSQATQEVFNIPRFETQTLTSVEEPVSYTHLRAHETV